MGQLGTNFVKKKLATKNKKILGYMFKRNPNHLIFIFYCKLLFNNGDGGVYVDSGDNSGHSDDNGSNNDVNINGDSNNNINDDNITMLGIVVASNYLY